MKQIILSLIMVVAASLACGNTLAAENGSKAQVAASKSTTVYYVVTGSFSTLSGAQEFLKSCHDGLEGPIYVTKSKGHTLYRICPDCFYSKTAAQKCAREINELIENSAWVWSSNGRAKCVYRGIAVNGEPFNLNPR